MYNEENREYDGNGTVDSRITSEQIVEDGHHKEKSKKGKKAVKFVASALVFGLVAGAVFQGVNYTADRLTKDPEVSEVTQSTGETKETADENLASVSVAQTETDHSTTVSQVVENVMPAIVSINCSSVVSQNVYGRIYQQPQSGSGSGIIIGQNQNEILIVTNNHVVAGENAQVEIVFHDESTANAAIKGTEASSDLAVVAVSLEDITESTKNSIKIATLGDSDTVKVGEMAIAIGNALGYGQSVTVGYISAKERKVSVEDATMTLLQTDAAINPGNSGGALLNASGEVIGINSVKYASTDVEGIGYAIPVSMAVPIINDLMNREELAESEKAYLGIRGDNVTEEYERFNMPIGVFVGEVTEGSPADKAGLSPKDIIVGIDGKTIETMEELQEFLSYTKAGETVALDVKVYNNGEYQDKQLSVTLGTRPAETEIVQ